MSEVRPAAVAGSFYTKDALTLGVEVSHFLTQAQRGNINPKALIVPHAGFIYSGSIAASAYSLLANKTEAVTKVVLIGPCHRVYISGLAIPSVRYFATPLGDVPLDTDTLESLQGFSQIVVSDEAHAQEHSLEVQLPFIQVAVSQGIFNQGVVDNIMLIPMAVGDVNVSEVEELMHYLWGGPETLILVSSDLSHFLDYASAKKIDAQTTTAIEQFKEEGIASHMACGSIAIKALLRVANEKQLRVQTLAQCNSGDTAGNKERVVGYASYAFS